MCRSFQRLTFSLFYLAVSFESLKASAISDTHTSHRGADERSHALVSQSPLSASPEGPGGTPDASHPGQRPGWEVSRAVFQSFGTVGLSAGTAPGAAVGRKPDPSSTKHCDTKGDSRWHSRGDRDYTPLSDGTQRGLPTQHSHRSRRRGINIAQIWLLAGVEKPLLEVGFIKYCNQFSVAC